MEIVEDWRKAHPNGKKADCIKDTGLSKPTVYKWWNDASRKKIKEEIVCEDWKEREKQEELSEVRKDMDGELDIEALEKALRKMRVEENEKFKELLKSIEEGKR